MVDAGGPRGAHEVGAMVGVEVPVMAVRHQIVTFPTLAEGAVHPFPLVLQRGQGVLLRGPRSRARCLGMSNAVG